MDITKLSQNMFDTINSLEISQIMILLIIFGFFLLCIKFKKEVKAVLKALTHKYLLISFIGILIWGFCVITILNVLGLWNKLLITDTIFLIFFNISYLVFTSYEILEKDNYFKDIIGENITISAFLVLIINLNVDILVKIVSAAFLLINGILLILSQGKKELNPTRIFAKFFIAIVAIILVIISLNSLLSNIGNLGNALFGYNTIITFIWPVILIILFLPYFYIFALFNEYLQIYNTISTFKSPDFSKKIFKMLFYEYHINIFEIYGFRKRLDYINYQSSDEDILNIFKQKELKFKLKNGFIYLNKKLIGKYETNSSIPSLERDVNKFYTKYNKIRYVVDYRESSYNNSYNSGKYIIGYIKTSNNIIKIYLCTDTKYTPISLWSTLIEQIINEQ